MCFEDTEDSISLLLEVHFREDTEALEIMTP